MKNQENKYYVYFLVDPRSDLNSFKLPFYIGKGCKNRCFSHLKESRDGTDNMKKWCKITAIRNAGYEPEVHIIKKNLSEDIAYDIEEKLIAYYGRDGIDETGILTNICSSNRPPNHAENGYKHSDETKRKIGGANSVALKGRINSEESNKKRSLKMKGRQGQPNSPETRAKLSAALKGRKCKPRTAEHQQNMWASRRKNGTVLHNEETKRKMSEKAKNRKKKQCDHCLKLIPPAVYARHHGNKCKFKFSQELQF